MCGDLARMPFAAGAFDLAWSNLALQWVDDLPQALSDLGRVLREGGLVSFSTFGPDTLRELRSAFAGIDRYSHVNRFVDMHDIGDMLVAAGFGDPVMHMEYVTLTYADATAMLRDLKAIGATNATQLRPRALMGRPPMGAGARRARSDAARRAPSGDVRSDLRPRVEGRRRGERRKGTRSCASSGEGGSACTAKKWRRFGGNRRPLPKPEALCDTGLRRGGFDAELRGRVSACAIRC